MPKCTAHRAAWIVWLVVAGPAAVFGRQAGAGDDIIDTIRIRTDIGAGDQDRVGRWVTQQIGAFTTAPELRKTLTEQFDNPADTPQFITVYAAKVGEAAAASFQRSSAKPQLTRSLARVLADIKRVETLPGLLAGLKATDSVARYLCARTLADLNGVIAADEAKVDRVVAVCREVGVVESSGVVLGRLYRAMAYDGFVPKVFDAYIALFDKRLAARRASPAYADGKEIDAFEFFRKKTVQDALSADQKTQLVIRLATFLRLDAERYGDADLNFDETDALERELWVNEEILAAVTGQTGGDIRGKLRTTGSDDRPGVVAEAYKWVGKPGAKKRGPLNTAPWNVPIGAP